MLTLTLALVLTVLFAPAQVQVAWSGDGTAVFAFRGTSKQQDAWQDLKLLRRGIPFLEEKYPGVKAHVGAPQLLGWVGHFACSRRALDGSLTTGMLSSWTPQPVVKTI